MGTVKRREFPEGLLGKIKENLNSGCRTNKSGTMVSKPSISISSIQT